MGAPGEGRYRNIAAGVWEGMMIWDRFWRRKQRDRETARDLQFYLDTETEENVARGMPLEQARLAAGGNSGIRT